MKRNLLLIIALILSVVASWAHDVEIDGIYYNIDKTNKTAKVTYSGKSHESVHDEYSGSVTIPETITYNSQSYSVTAIHSLTFYGCSGLTSVTIPNSVTYIGLYAFDGCSGLTSVTIPNSVTFIGSGAFRGCSGLISVTIPNGVTSIGVNTFRGCSGLTSVTIPNSVTSIGEYAFLGCSGLTSVTIPNSITSIGKDTFYGCSGLTSVTIPNSVTSIGEYAFNGCRGLTSVTIPNSVTSIGEYAFNLCRGLTSVTIPNSVTSIGEYAFYGCSGLTSVTIPNSVTSIGSAAFNCGSGLTEVLVLSNNEEFSSENGVLYNKDKTTLITYPEGKKDSSFTIPTSVTSIGEYAFYGCSGLTSVTIPTSVTSIGSAAFSICNRLTEILVLSNNEEFSSENGVLYNKDKTTLIKYPRGKKDTSFTIPTSVTSIGEDTFDGCMYLTSVTIPNSVTSIDSAAFKGCGGLTSVTIPKSVTSIGEDTFNGCNNLKTVYNCSSLDIVKGQSTNGYVAYYADEVINGCPVGDFIFNYADEIIEYIGDTTVNKIEIPEFVTGIEPDVFASCANIDTIVWNAIDCADFTETTAPFNAQAAQIKSVIFGNHVEYIPAYLCSDMTLLMEVSIPSKVNSIGENTFKGCSRLKFITSYPPLVPLAKENSFNSYSAYLYIPCDYYDYYYLDDVFGKFKEIKCISAEEVEGSEKVEIEVDSNNNATIIWPSTGNASSYEIVISKNGEVFCTLLFNENGQLTSIDFGNRSASVGFQFTVTGLDGASKYSYSIVAKDEKGNELESYNGTFTTNGYSEETAILETLADANITVTGGTISADTDFTIYNTIGQNVTAKNGSLTPGVYVVKVGDDIAKVMVK